MALATVTKIRPAVIDERGEITNILDAPIQHVALITSKAGSVRGNHFHPEQVQNDYLLKGKYEYVTKDVRSGEERLVVIEAGDLVITPPMVAHAMRFLEDSAFLTFTTGSRDSKTYESHTKQFRLI